MNVTDSHMHLYVIDFGQDRVKIGKTNNLDRRLGEYRYREHRDAHLHGWVSVERSLISQAEIRLRRRMRTVARRWKGLEYFYTKPAIAYAEAIAAREWCHLMRDCADPSRLQTIQDELEDDDIDGWKWIKLAQEEYLLANQI